ncbi:lipid-A-disaccharide synthase [Caulobacter vibrioides]|uniref:lipid-A-disaccharide synthase n=1 Tax=Caulobacter vibrioides TaxID=155892 RepID=UPI000BB4C5EF|nr:lipid-A-disaccharide synthase [Caulobacter vibrioides]ATC24874.1 lipid-A-disaccharide synthase [Caulobacter vibrioides]AZH13032.1 lipid-A-disaccharide synthase [Caulobacter vibrioides]PLR09652.1 lipid-A-disaccharide synthase [Caulobacter vibrioides]
MTINRDKPLKVMLVAAEASGDALGAGLAKALRARLGQGVTFVGIGGAKMAEQGVQSPFDIAQLSILGILESLKAYPRAMARLKDTVALAAREKPDVAVLIDSWGFNIRLAHALRRLDPTLPLVKYVAPQVWAYREGRAQALAKAVDLLLSIQPMDKAYFDAAGLQNVFVGNSALAKRFDHADPGRLRAAIGAAASEQILLVLPGSRPSEIERVMPAFEDAVRRLKVERPDLHIVVPAAYTVAEAVKARVAGWPFRAHVIEDEGLKDDAFLAGDVALACSGTVTTELALAGRPMVVGYKTGAVTYAIVKRLMKPRWITLFNIAAGKAVAPEFIQHDCEGQGLAREVALRLDDPDLRQHQTAEQYAALDRMGRGMPDPSEAAAEALVDFLSARRALGRAG